MTAHARPRLLVASANAGKVHEIARLLAGLDLDVVGLEAFPGMPELPEPYATFHENAASKALAAAEHAGCLALADDSGLQVPALDNRPGVYSSRYAASDSARIARLLEEMQGLSGEQRQARFVCVLVLAAPGRVVGQWEGVCSGRIAEAPRGAHGFGFDPVFTYGEHTFAEMSSTEKNKVSHRGVALRAMLEDLPGCLHDLA